MHFSIGRLASTSELLAEKVAVLWHFLRKMKLAVVPLLSGKQMKTAGLSFTSLLHFGGYFKSPEVKTVSWTTGASFRTPVQCRSSETSFEAWNVRNVFMCFLLPQEAGGWISAGESRRRTSGHYRPNPNWNEIKFPISQEFFLALH